jgi:hypothetical protein
MGEGADYDPGEWRGHDFGKAKKAYDAHVGRGYADATMEAAKGVTISDKIPVFIETQCENPLHVLCDTTGSMGAWPPVIFSKLPYLDIEGKTYMGEDMEISFASIGDFVTDKYAIQVRPYDQGKKLKTQLEALICEGQGGSGDSCESYAEALLYYARNTRMPKAVRPILVIIGDENFRDYVEKSKASQLHVKIAGPRIDTTDIFEELKRKFAVYLVRKRYDDGSKDGQIHKRWADMLGADHVVPLEEPERVVDIIFGILARETGKIAYFRTELEGRQRPEQVETVYTSLKTVHANVPPPTAKKPPKGHSIMAGLPEGKKAKGLLNK